MTDPELTDAMIAEALARAEKEACSPGDDRCYPLPDPLNEARQTRTPKGRCKIGWNVVDSGRKSWDVWLDIHTGEGRLRCVVTRSATGGTQYAASPLVAEKDRTMDGGRFDAVTRAVAAGASRRRTMVLAVGGALGALSLPPAAKKDKNTKKQRRPRCDRCPARVCCRCGGAPPRCLLLPASSQGTAACNAACAPDPNTSAQLADGDGVTLGCSALTDCVVLRCPV